MRTLTLWLLLFMALDSAECFAFTRGCASRGGPGWRTPQGRCVGWDALPGKCGFPPEKGCSFEGAAYAHSVTPGATRDIWSKLRETFHLLRESVDRKRQEGALPTVAKE